MLIHFETEVNKTKKKIKGNFMGIIVAVYEIEVRKSNSSTSCISRVVLLLYCLYYKALL